MPGTSARDYSEPANAVAIAVIVRSWRQQRDLVDDLHEENRVLRGQLGPRRLRFTDSQRIRLAIKESCLDRLILISEDSLRRAIREFMAHYHHERNHQGMGNLLLFPLPPKLEVGSPIACRPRLGGLLKYYHRPAA